MLVLLFKHLGLLGLLGYSALSLGHPTMKCVPILLTFTENFFLFHESAQVTVAIDMEIMATF